MLSLTKELDLMLGTTLPNAIAWIPVRVTETFFTTLSHCCLVRPRESRHDFEAGPQFSQYLRPGHLPEHASDLPFLFGPDQG